jgi:hypothetical protein
MDFEQKLNTNNFSIYITKSYHKKDGMYSTKELNKDVKLLNYLNRNLKRYHNNKSINLQIIKNQIVTIYQLWDSTPMNRALFYVAEPILHSYIKTLLYYHNVLDENIKEVDVKKIKIDYDFLDELQNA